MKRTFLKPASFMCMALAAALSWGCKENNKEQLTPAQQQANATAAAQDNTQIISATQEMLDVTSGAFSEKGITEGRTITEGRENTGGCKPTVSGTFKLDTLVPDSLIYSGAITVDYDAGASCPDSLHRRSGKITDTFIYTVSLKNKFLYSSTETISFEDFQKDTVRFSGNVIVKSTTRSPTTVEAQSTRITYADGTFAQWSGVLSFEYQRIHGSRDWGGSTITLTGSLNGTSREKADFSASISKGILFRNTCKVFQGFIPLSGTVDVSTNGATSVVDYGDGSCDKTYTITTNGTTTIHVLDKDKSSL